MPSRRQRCILYERLCKARKKPSLLGLCRAAANFRASECNRACSYCRAQPKISKQIFLQASAIFVQASAIELAHIAERSRKCQEIELAHIAERSRKSQSKFSGKRVQNRTIALSQMSKIEFTRILPWRAIALLRTCSGYAERSRIFVQASAIFVQASAIELAHIAERSRKSQRKMSRKGAFI